MAYTPLEASRILKWCSTNQQTSCSPYVKDSVFLTSWVLCHASPLSLLQSNVIIDLSLQSMCHHSTSVSQRDFHKECLLNTASNLTHLNTCFNYRCGSGSYNNRVIPQWPNTVSFYSHREAQKNTCPVTEG